MSNKKGFTLVEIIICIMLIVSIGTVTSVSLIKSNKENDILLSNKSNFENALEVYLSNHPEVVNNVNNNVKGAVISLELLKNEGLISDGLNIDYKEHFFTLANAVLLEDDKNLDKECSNTLSIKTIASWDISDSSSEVIYICPRKSGDTIINNNINNLTEVKYSLILGSLFENVNYIAKGENPNNWVELKVNSDESYITSFPNDVEKDLWRILSIDSSGNTKLIYNKPLYTDNTKNNADYYSQKHGYDIECLTGTYGDGDYNVYCKIYENFDISYKDEYYRNWNIDGWSYYDVVLNSIKKNIILEMFGDNKKLLIEWDYYYKYNGDNLNIEDKVSTYLGTISYNEYQSTFFSNKTWISYLDSCIIGEKFFNSSGNFDDVSTGGDTLDGYGAYTTFITPSYLYVPVITLKNEVNILYNETETCTGDKIQGSKECPYLLECNDC